MNSCDDIRGLLPLNSGDDLAADEALLVGQHLAKCESCRIQDEKYRSMIVAARSAYSGEYQIPSGVRRMIAAEAAARVSRGSWNWPLSALLPRQVPVLATAIAAILVIVAGLPIALRQSHQRAVDGGIAQVSASGSKEEVMRIDVVADGDAVKLAWSDGNRQSYTIYKTTDPRAGAYQEAHQVNGHVWVDSDPESSPLVFYKIE